jgi:hypothetical protein
MFWSGFEGSIATANRLNMFIKYWIKEAPPSLLFPYTAASCTCVNDLVVWDALQDQ